MAFTPSATVGNDIINGDAAPDTIDGLAGDDIILGGGGDDVLLGGPGNDRLDGGTGNDRLLGGPGDDRYDVDRTDTIIELANEGNDSIFFRDDTFTGTYNLAANVENLTMIGRFNNLSALGNNLDNRIFGNNTGDDTLSGGDGNDYIQGDFAFFAGSNSFFSSAGADVLRGGAGNDVIWGDQGEGTDLMVSVAADMLFGDSGDDILYGQAGADMLDGGTGNDTLYGGAGADTLLGDTGDDFLDSGTGNDVLDAGSGQNRLIFQKGDGQDIVRGVATLGTADRTGIELVTSYLAGSLGAGSIGIASTEVTLTRTGNDLLIDRNDGDDSVKVENYFASSATNLYPVHSIKFSDTVWSNADINSRVTGQPATPPAPSTTQIGTDGNDILTGTAAADILLGRAGDDYLAGGAGNDFLNGETGKDLLEGGTGDDTLVVDNVLDVITERPGEGTDTVQSYISYMLGGNVENLTLIGNIAISATGNELDNFLVGNSLNNVMLGRSGNDVLYGDAGDDFLNGEMGQDQMFGGVGNDTVIVNDAGDYVWEAVNEGTDTVQSYISYTLQANFENLILIGGTGVVANGNALANVIQGNDADNRIDGMGGLDSLMGNGGNDRLTIHTGQERVAGGSGFDTLQFGANLGLLNLAGLAGVSLTGIEAIDMQNGNASILRFTLGQMLALSLESNTLKIDGDVGDQLQIGTGWQRGTSGTAGYDQYSWTTGGETGVVLVGQNVTVTMGDWMAT